MDEIDYNLHEIRKAIKHMSETTIGKQKFEEVVKKLNLGGKDITSEGVPLRWDSTFFMLQIALELRRQGEAFVDLHSSDCVFRIRLSREEWDKAEAMHKCLTVFYDAICSFLASKCLRAFTSARLKDFVYFTSKTYFFLFYTIIFTKHPHQFIYFITRLI